jgi:hypothetical protein
MCGFLLRSEVHAASNPGFRGARDTPRRDSGPAAAQKVTLVRATVHVLTLRVARARYLILVKGSKAEGAPISGNTPHALNVSRR